MFKSTKKSLAITLIEQLNVMRKSEKKDIFALYKLRHQAEAYEQEDAVRAHMILGMIATLEGQAEKMRYHYEKSINFAPNDTFTRLNYITSLRTMGDFSKALQQSKALLHLQPKALKALNLVIKNTLSCCRLQEAFNYLQQWYAINPLEEPEYTKTIEEGARLLVQNGLSDDAAEAVQSTAFDLLRRKNISFVDEYVEYFKDESTECLVYKVIVDLPICDVIKLNKQLDKVLDNDLSETVIFLYKSKEILAQPQLKIKSLEGHLLMIEENSMVRLRPRGCTHMIPCSFERTMQTQVYQNVLQFVRVRGIAKEDPIRNKIISFKIDAIEPLKEETFSDLLQTDGFDLQADALTLETDLNYESLEESNDEIDTYWRYEDL